MKMFRSRMSVKAVMAVAVSGLLALGACAYGPKDGVYTAPDSCLMAEGAKAALEKAYWPAAKEIRLSITAEEIEPMVHEFYAQKAHTLIIKNNDSLERIIYAPDFYEAIAIKDITPASATVKNGCPKTIEVAAGEEVVMRFVPITGGRYELFKEPWPFKYAENAIGLITIIE